MKKCPKCGTILDDSKKKCYMCGCDLHKSNITNFGDVFDTQIGATVTKGQDNVFNNVNNISAEVNDVFNNGNNTNNVSNSATFTNKSSSADFYKNQINSLNSMQYDERTALEKIFSGDSRFRSKDEINAEEAMKKNNESNFNSDIKKDSTSLFGGNSTSGDLQQTFTPPVENNNLNNIVNESKKKNVKPMINWGNNLSDNRMVSDYKDKTGKKFSINISFVVNTVCFILFLCGLGYIYFTYIKPEKEKNVNFGGLNYTIGDDFLLKTEDTYSKYYTMGDNCSIRISYGYTNDVSSYVDDYFEQIKEDFSEEKGYTSITEDMRINNNMWNSLSIMQLEQNAAGTGGYAPNILFKYISIVYKGSFYNITYSNTRGDNTCSSEFDQLVETLAFD